MARKWTSFFRTMGSFLKQLQLKTYRRVLILFLVGILVAVGIPPVLSQKPGNPLIAKSWAEAQELEERGREHYLRGKEHYQFDKAVEDWQKAVEDWQRAAQAFAALGEDLKQAIILGNLSLAYQQLGEWEEAEKAIAKSLNLLGFKHDSKTPKNWQIPNVSTDKLDKLKILGPALEIYGRFWYGKGNPENALSSWQLAADIYQKKLNVRQRIIGNQFNQSQAMQDLGLYPRACNTLLEALEINIQDIGKAVKLDIQDCQLTKSNKKKLNKEELEKFTDQFQLILQEKLDKLDKLDKKKPEFQQKFNGLVSLGDVFRGLGNLELSQIILTKLLNEVESPNETEEGKIIASSPNIAAAHISLGNTARALGNKKNQQVRQTKQQMTSSNSVDSCINDKINDKKDSNQTVAEFYHQAEACYQKAAAEELSTSLSSTIQARINLLSLLVQTQQWSKVQNLLSTIQSSLADLPTSRTAVNARINLAQSLMCFKKPTLNEEERKHSSPLLQKCALPNEEDKTPSNPPTWEKIAEILTEALNQAQNSGNHRGEANARGYLGGVYQQMGKIKLAQEETEKALYLAQPTKTPEIAYQWQWQLGRLLKAQSAQVQTAEAKEIFLKKAEAAYKEAYRTVNSLREDLLYTKREIQFHFRDQFEPIYREYVSLRLPFDNKVTFNNKDDDPAQFIQLPPGELQDENPRQVIADLQLAELENFLDCKLVYSSKFVDVDRVVDKAKQKTAAIYPIILEDRIEVLLKLPQKEEEEEERLYRRFPPVQISQKKVKEKLKELRKELEQPYFSSKRGKPAAEEVYKWLIEPAEKNGLLEREQTLVFVLDGPFRNISMAALYDGNEYLIQKYAIAVALGNLELPDSQPTTQFKALIASHAKKPQCKNPECDQFGPLEYVKQEVDEINDVLQKRDVEAKVLYDDQFTSKALENEIKTAPYNIVHLATHGEFGFSRDSTFILTAPPESEDKLLRKKDNLKTPFSNQEKKSDTNSEGKITSTNATLYDFEDIKADLNELNNLLQVREQAPIELLVLSACETGEGDAREVLGIAGMAVQSGARTTLASLWSVDDWSTVELMEQFYQKLLENGENRVTKAEALRQAQLHLLKNPAAYKPSHWAPYILVGDWR